VTARLPLVLGSMVMWLLAACQSEPIATDFSEREEPSFAAATQTQSSRFPIDLTFFVPCANGGLGELVALSGQLHDVFHLTLDGRGGFHVKTHSNPQGVSGVGLTTGTRYRGTGVTQERFNVKIGERNTFINNFRIVGRGPGNNFLVHENVHLTINANGVASSFHDHFRASCK
jgi:hypothetical protein